MKKFISFLRDEKATTAIEYALLVGLIAIGLVLALTQTGKEISSFFRGLEKVFRKVIK